MPDTDAPIRLDFSELHGYKYPNRGITPPPLPVRDHRIVAGILFRRSRDIRMYLHIPISQSPYISDGEYGRGQLSIDVTQEAVDKLLELNAIEGLRSWGYSKQIQQLSARQSPRGAGVVYS